jgi:hypothetical protein
MVAGTARTMTTLAALAGALRKLTVPPFSLPTPDTL